ncbi:MAG: hypothetical protein M1839_005955 [Geoglossum umbratile]|nr:MAG: hypothetical protein M1839_005955 [Geoglossum umbratile]
MHEVLIEMLANKQSKFEETVAKQKTSLRNKFKNKLWLGDTNCQVAYKAINLVNTQWLMLLASKQDRRKQLKPCTGAFRKQLGLPCVHELEQMLEGDGNAKLVRSQFNKFWWLDQSLNEEEPLLRIQDPDVVQNTRGRPRGTGPFAESAPPPSTAPAALGTATALAPRGHGSRGRTGRSSHGYGNNTKLSERDPQLTKLSVRRTRSQWELEDVSELERPPPKRQRQFTSISKPKPNTKPGTKLKRGILLEEEDEEEIGDTIHVGWP